MVCTSAVRKPGKLTASAPRTQGTPKQRHVRLPLHLGPLRASVSPSVRGQYLHLAQGQQRKRSKNPHTQAPLSPPPPSHKPKNNSEGGTHGSQASLPALHTVGTEPAT